ncbi:MAG: hypothetical protein WED01_12955 [Candidatus Rokuibacteriota bacterium]
MTSSSRWCASVLLALIVAVIPSAAFGQPELIGDYHKALEGLFDRWNKREVQDRGALKNMLLPALSARAENRPAGYEDQDWLREITAKIDNDVPGKITPKLPVADDARKRYIDYVRVYRLPLYVRPDVRLRVPGLAPDQDLQPKTFLLLSIAEREAILDRDSQIRFKHLRRAMFFWLTGLFP